ncbi:MAG: phosphatidate cytidylyltransferase [Deltaproteobacteria bacterium]|nr:phosphatidate cytidylyltransferase [Deltaproteobacteria bacterium]
MLIFGAPVWIWRVVVVLISTLALVEYGGLAFTSRVGPRVVGGLLGVVVILAGVSAPEPGVRLAAALSAMLAGALSYVVLARRDLDRGLADVGLITIGVLYTGLLLPHFYWLRVLPDGAAWVTFVIAIAMAGDSSGYFVGHALGRHKLIPHVSPGKTVEGAIGIIAGSLVAAALAKLVLEFLGVLSPRSWTEILTLATVMALIGQVGDLTESVMKRSFGAKESGALFPGHGGVLDRIDSLLFPVALVYYYLNV